MKRALLFAILSTLLLSGCNNNNKSDVESNGLIYEVISGLAYVSSYTNEVPEQLVIPEKVESYRVIGIINDAFSHCDRIKEVSFAQSSSIKTIGKFAFCGCLSLTSIVIPNSVTSIGERAFLGCSLESITFPLFEGCNPAKIFDGSSIKEVVINEGCELIYSNSFYGCSSLTSITIPNTVTSIGDYAFYGCSSLTSVTIPNRVTSIGSFAFSGCRSMASIAIPDGATSIGDYAFSYCFALTSVAIPNSVTSIGDHAFSGCTSLTIYCEAPSKPSGWDSSWNYSCRPVVWNYKQ